MLRYHSQAYLLRSCALFGKCCSWMKLSFLSCGDFNSANYILNLGLVAFKSTCGRIEVGKTKVDWTFSMLFLKKLIMIGNCCCSTCFPRNIHDSCTDISRDSSLLMSSTTNLHFTAILVFSFASQECIAIAKKWLKRGKTAERCFGD